MRDRLASRVAGARRRHTPWAHTVDPSLICYVPVSNPPNTVQPRTPLSGGWCQPVTGANGTGTYTYQVCPSGPPGPSTCAQAGTLQVVSIGNTSGVTRRVDVLAKSSSGQQIFLDAGLKSQTNIALDSNAIVQSPSSAGGNISLGSTSTQLCGLSTVGPDGTLSGSGGYYAGADCTNPIAVSTVGHQSLTLPPVNQGDAATNNDNVRITNAKSSANPQPIPKDLISGNKNDVTWDPSTRQLSLTGQKTSLTLTGEFGTGYAILGSTNFLHWIPVGTVTNNYGTVQFADPSATNLPRRFYRARDN